MRPLAVKSEKVVSLGLERLTLLDDLNFPHEPECSLPWNPKSMCSYCASEQVVRWEWRSQSRGFWFYHWSEGHEIETPDHIYQSYFRCNIKDLSSTSGWVTTTKCAKWRKGDCLWWLRPVQKNDPSFTKKKCEQNNSMKVPPQYGGRHVNFLASTAYKFFSGNNQQINYNTNCKRIIWIWHIKITIIVRKRCFI